MTYFQLNIFNNFNLLWYFRRHGKSKCKWHFLNVLFVRRSPSCHGAALFSLITLFFLSYSYFRHFALNHYGPKPYWSVGPVWNNKCKCQRSAHAFPLSGHSFGFPQVVRECTFDLCKAPLGWHKSFAMWTQLVPARHMANVMCRAENDSDTWP